MTSLLAVFKKLLIMAGYERNKGHIFSILFTYRAVLYVATTLECVRGGGFLMRAGLKVGIFSVYYSIAQSPPGCLIPQVP